MLECFPDLLFSCHLSNGNKFPNKSDVHHVGLILFLATSGVIFLRDSVIQDNSGYICHSGGRVEA